jgi:hypothetical protein
LHARWTFGRARSRIAEPKSRKKELLDAATPGFVATDDENLSMSQLVAPTSTATLPAILSPNFFTVSDSSARNWNRRACSRAPINAMFKT